MKKNRSGMGLIFLILIMLLLIVWIGSLRNQNSNYTWMEFEQDYEQNAIQEVEIQPNKEVPTGAVKVTLNNGYTRTLYVSDVTKVEQTMQEWGITTILRDVPKENWFVVEGTHQPVIDTDTFQKAQRILSLNMRAGAKGNVYPLGGILKCGECKKAMARKSARGKVYYGCRTYREKGKRFCKSHSIGEGVLFNAVLEAINLQVSRIGDMQALLQRVHHAPKRLEYTESLASKIKLSQKELDSEVKVFDKTYYDLVHGNISQEQFKRIRAICEKRQNELHGIIKALSEEIKKAAQTAGGRPAYLDIFQNSKRFEELTRNLSFNLIESVYVYSDRSVEINFRFTDPHTTCS